MISSRSRTPLRLAGALVVALGLLVISPGAASPVPPRVVFATSAEGSGDLGSWPEADFGTIGLAAADSICRNLATGVLDDAQDFVAWVSDSSDDAYCRIHGLTGKKEDDCGQPSLPDSAGPWVRTDGHPFAPTIDRLLSPSNEVYAAIQYDENGQLVGGDNVFAGTFVNGAAAAELCTDPLTLLDWTSDSGSVTGRYGSTYHGSATWTSDFVGFCDFPQRLFCFQKGAGGPLPPFPQSGKRAFVSSALGPGDLGSWPQAAGGTTGVAAGDSICQSLAAAASLPVPSAFRVWLSDGTVDAIDRFLDPGPWVRADGVVVFPSRDDLATFGLFSALNVAETGSYVTGGRVWTGTASSGLAAGDRCGEWLVGTSAADGQVGLPTILSPGWTQNQVRACDGSNRLYCLSVADGVFGDGFESGDVSAWSAAAP